MSELEEFESFDNATLRYLDVGRGPIVILLHGFAAEHELNWVRTGTVDALVASGCRVIALDQRGHGRSDAPHEVERYADGAFVRDVRGLIDHLGATSVQLVGYSMGALVAARTAAVEPRVNRVVLGGIGASLNTERRSVDRDVIAAAMLTEDPSGIEDPVARLFRQFVDATGADRRALAAVQRGQVAERLAINEVGCPALVLCGVGDDLAGDPVALAARMPDASAQLLEGNHLTALNDPNFNEAIVRFVHEQR